VPQIEVTFDIDANGILNVSAKDLGTGKEQKISITGSSGLTKDEVERLRHEAEAHAEEDRKKFDLVEARNAADNLAYQSEKQLKDLGDKLAPDRKQDVEDAIKAVREALNGNDLDAIKKATDDLQTRFQAVSADLYKQAASQTKPQEPAAGAGEAPKAEDSQGSEKVVDADFEVVDEEKRNKH